MKKFSMLLLACFTILATQSCGNREVQYGDVTYDESTQTVLYEDKPYNGTVMGDSSHPNEKAIVKNGKVVDIITTTELSNGYKEIRHKDGSCEYYDYNGDRISKSEFEKNN